MLEKLHLAAILKFLNINIKVSKLFSCEIKYKYRILLHERDCDTNYLPCGLLLSWRYRVCYTVCLSRGNIQQQHGYVFLHYEQENNKRISKQTPVIQQKTSFCVSMMFRCWQCDKLPGVPTWPLLWGYCQCGARWSVWSGILLLCGCRQQASIHTWQSGKRWRLCQVCRVVTKVVTRFEPLHVVVETSL